MKPMVLWVWYLPDWLPVCQVTDFPVTCAQAWSVERSWPDLGFDQWSTWLPNCLLQDQAESWKTAFCHHCRERKMVYRAHNNRIAKNQNQNQKSDLLARDTSPASDLRYFFPSELRVSAGCCAPTEKNRKTFIFSKERIKFKELVKVNVELSCDLPWVNQRSFFMSAIVIRESGLASSNLVNKPEVRCWIGIE